MPARVIVFGISSLPAQALEALAGLARFSQVLLCVHNPCRHHWSDIVADKDLLRHQYKRQARKAGMPAALDVDILHQHAHPLLAAWGKQGRDYINLLDSYDDPNSYRAAFRDGRIDLFSEVEPLNLLNQLQDDILELRPLNETRELWPAVDLDTDRSIRFHIAHSAQRKSRSFTTNYWPVSAEIWLTATRRDCNGAGRRQLRPPYSSRVWPG